jgi:hypothetical protein
MASIVQDIAVWDYSGPQGSKELEFVEASTISRTKSRARVKTMNRARRALAYQSGTEEVELSLTVVPQLVNPEVDWKKAWKDDELFDMTAELGLDGVREGIRDCIVSDVNDTHNENGEARQEVSIMGLVTRDE